MGDLVIGGDDIGRLLLVDLVDNQGDGADNEVLFVQNLIVGDGSSLDLGGVNLYYGSASIDPGATITPNGGELLEAIPEPSTFAMLLLGAACCVVRARRGRRLRPRSG